MNSFAVTYENRLRYFKEVKDQIAQMVININEILSKLTILLAKANQHPLAQYITLRDKHCRELRKLLRNGLEVFYLLHDPATHEEDKEKLFDFLKIFIFP